MIVVHYSITPSRTVHKEYVLIARPKHGLDGLYAIRHRDVWFSSKLAQLTGVCAEEEACFFSMPFVKVVYDMHCRRQLEASQTALMQALLWIYDDSVGQQYVTTTQRQYPGCIATTVSQPALPLRKEPPRPVHRTQTLGWRAMDVAVYHDIGVVELARARVCPACGFPTLQMYTKGRGGHAWDGAARCATCRAIVHWDVDGLLDVLMYQRPVIRRRKAANARSIPRAR